MAIVKTIDKDLGAIKLLIELDKLNKKPGIKVGWPVESSKTSESHSDSALSVVQIAIVHEFGAPSVGIPERSMIRATYDAKKKQWELATDKLAKKIGTKITVDQALEVLGLLMVKDNKTRISSGIAPELKHRDGTALIDTSQMVNSLTFVKIVGKK